MGELVKSERCPTPEQLEQFVLGKLSELELAPVAMHAEFCQRCQSLLNTLDEKQDDLLHRLRVGAGSVPRRDVSERTTVTDLDSASVIECGETTISADADRVQKFLRNLESVSDRKLAKAQFD
jgi:hypothetical protein